MQPFVESTIERIKHARKIVNSILLIEQIYDVDRSSVFCSIGFVEEMLKVDSLKEIGFF
ncbi:hypothetical protein [Peribacillus butanolivorans]|uniref:hypothetical protein n=1 Tax=Peribacillus butanolivorans TaxID=421767 RepID=UPI0015970171|nr:hypothetical protein [Peribacillus butanolivorans]